MRVAKLQNFSLPSAPPKTWIATLHVLLACFFSITSFAQVVKLQTVGGASAVVSSNGTVTQMGSAGAAVTQGAAQANQSGLLFGVLDFRPAQQATGVTLANPTPTSLQIGWTNGNGARRVVLARVGTAVTAAPQAATFYAADAAFGSGTLLNTDHYVIYEGSGNTITMTNLAPSTRYHVKVFEYNGKYGNNNANIEYQTGDGTGNPASRITLALPPTLAATNLTFTNVTKSSQTVNWQNGNSSQRLVVARKEIAPTALPANGETYIASSAFGTRELGAGNSIVYIGAGNQVTVAGLEPNTVYHYRVIDFTGSGEDNHYLTTTTLLGSQLTLTHEPQAMDETAVGLSTFTANWNAVTGATAYYLDVSDNAGFNTFHPNNENRKITAGLAATVTELEPGTTYFYRVRAENAAGASANSNVIEVLTLPATPTLSASTNIQTTSFVANWSASKSAVDYRLDVATNSSFTALVDGFADREVRGTFQTVTGLNAGTLYYVRVRARNASGLSPNPLAAFVQVTRPAAPVLLQTPQSEVTESSFILRWQPVQGADRYLLYVVEEATNQPVAGLNPLERPATANFASASGLRLSTYYKYYMRAANAAGESEASETFITLTKGPGATVRISILAAETSAARAAATVANGRAPYQVSFGHRRISGTSFTRLESTANVATTVRQDLNPAWLDELGLEFYFVVRDAAAVKDSVRGVIYRAVDVANIPPLEFAFNGDRKGYQIFSIPAELLDKTITSMLRPLRSQFDGYDKTKWRVFHYPGGVDQEYLEYEKDLFNIDPGKGYWLNATTRLNPVPVAGSVIKANQSAPFEIELARGWNQIGNPYPFNIDWSVVRMLKENESVGLNALWAPTAGEYQKANVLAAWRGGFVFSDNGGRLKFPVTSRTLATGRTQADEMTGSLDESTWQLPIRVALNEVAQASGIGMHPQARAGKDQFDEIVIPRFVDFVELSTSHPDFFAPRFSVDVVAPQPRHEWTFALASSDASGTVSLSWDAQPIVQATASLLLVDRQAGAWVDMRHNHSYSFPWTENKKLSIVYQRDGEWQPGVTLLGAAHPNPFDRHVTIPVLTEHADQIVDVQVFDLTGRELRLLKSQFSTPGPNAVSWDGTDTAGNPVSPGPLFYRLKNVPTAHGAKRLIKK